MKIGYIRVSTNTQKTDRQDDIMKELGVEKIYTEKLSGKNSNRPELKKLLDFIREGDVVVVSDISRLARSIRDLLSMIDIFNEKKVGFISLKESIDTTTPQGRFVLTLFGALAELERENIMIRMQEGFEAARERGVKFGRPRKEFPKNWKQIYDNVKKGLSTPTEAANTLQIKRPTFYALVKRWENETDQNL